MSDDQVPTDPPAAPAPSRRSWIVALRMLVSAALLGLLLSRVDLWRLLAMSRRLSLPFVLLAVALQLGGVLVSSAKWWLLLRARGQQVPYGWTIRAYLVGQFFSNFLPTMIGGDAVRILQLRERIGRTAVAVASVFVERLTGFVALTAIAWAALGLHGAALLGVSRLRWVAVSCLLLATGGVTIALAAPILLRLAGRLPLPNVLDWRRRLADVASALSAYRTVLRALAAVVALSFGYQLSWILTNSVAAHALGLRVPFSFMALMVPLSDIVGLVPLFFNSLGAREGAYVLLLGRLGIPAVEAVTLSFVIFVVRLVVSLLGGAFYLLGSVRPGRIVGRKEDAGGVSSG